MDEFWEYVDTVHTGRLAVQDNGKILASRGPEQTTKNVTDYPTEI